LGISHEIDYLKDHNNELSEYLLINLLWIATPEERKEALKYLDQLTGLQFTTPKEWINYWREKSQKTGS